MDDLKTVIDFCFHLLETELTFPPYHFSILSILVSLAVISTIMYFVSRIFEH